MSKNAEISKRIMNLVNSGVNIRDAINTVLGAGSYEKLAGDIWEAMQK